MNNQQRKARLAQMAAADALSEARRLQGLLERRGDLHPMTRQLIAQSAEAQVAKAQALRTGRPVAMPGSFERQNLL